MLVATLMATCWYALSWQHVGMLCDGNMLVCSVMATCWYALSWQHVGMLCHGNMLVCSGMLVATLMATCRHKPPTASIASAASYTLNLQDKDSICCICCVGSTVLVSFAECRVPSAECRVAFACAFCPCPFSLTLFTSLLSSFPPTLLPSLPPSLTSSLPPRTFPPALSACLGGGNLSVQGNLL